MSSGIEYRSFTFEIARPSVFVSPALRVELGGSKRSCAAGPAFGCGAAPAGADWDADGFTTGSAITPPRYTRTFVSVPAAIVRRFSALMVGKRMMCGVIR